MTKTTEAQHIARLVAKCDALNERIGEKEARGDMRGMMGSRGMYAREAALRKDIAARRNA